MHPIVTDHIRTFLTNHSLTKLLLFYGIIVLIISLLCGISFEIFDLNNNYDIINWVEYAFLLLFNSSPQQNISLTPPQRIISMGEAFFSVVLPTLLLGSIAFKVFINPNTIVFRKHLSVYYHDRKQRNVLGFRYYSASRLSFVDMTISIILNVRYSDSIGRGTPIGTSLVLKKAEYPILFTHVPHTIVLELDENDLDITNKKLISIKGHKLESCPSIQILIKGEIPTLGQSFTYFHTYLLPDDIQWGRYQGIAVYGDYSEGTQSHEWAGWSNFEGVESESSEPQ